MYEEMPESFCPSNSSYSLVEGFGKKKILPTLALLLGSARQTQDLGLQS